MRLSTATARHAQRERERKGRKKNRRGGGGGGSVAPPTPSRPSAHHRPSPPITWAGTAAPSSSSSGPASGSGSAASSGASSTSSRHWSTCGAAKSAAARADGFCETLGRQACSQTRTKSKRGKRRLLPPSLKERKMPFDCLCVFRARGGGTVDRAGRSPSGRTPPPRPRPRPRSQRPPRPGAGSGRASRRPRWAGRRAS